jgi:hypothetical protein
MMGMQTEFRGKELLKVTVRGQPKNLLVLRGVGSNELFKTHLLVETINRKHGTGLTVVSHEAADVALTGAGAWKNPPNFAVDAFIAYEKPGVRLGREIRPLVHGKPPADGEPNVVLETGRYDGETDVALIAMRLAPADLAYTLGSVTRTLAELLNEWDPGWLEALSSRDVNEIRVLVPDGRLMVVPDFPRYSGWYMQDPSTGIPSGTQVFHRCPDARCLYRLNSPYVGLPVRGDYFRGDRYGILALWEMSYRLGVVAEVPDADVPKIQALIDRQNVMYS